MSAQEPVAELPASCNNESQEQQSTVASTLSSADAEAEQVCDMLRFTLGDASAVRVFVQLLERHVERPVLTKVCASLCTLTTQEANIDAFNKNSGVQILHKLIKSRLHVPCELLTHACTVMCNVTANSADNRTNCVAAGCVETMVKLLREHHKGYTYPLEKPCYTLLEKACATLVHMTTSPESHRKFGAAGGVEVLIELLKRDVLDEPSLLVTRACQVLRNVSVLTDNKVKAGAVGGVEVVVDLIKRYLFVPVELTQQACGALNSLMVYDDNRVACSKAGGVEALINVLTDHAHNDPEDCADLFVLVCGALRQAIVTPTIRVKCKVVESLVNIIKKYQSLPAGLIETACAALRNFTVNMSQHPQACGEIGGVEALVSVIQYYSTADGPVELLEHACGALRHTIAISDAYKAKCIQAGAVPTLVHLIERHMTAPPNAPLQHQHDFFAQACAALNSVAVFSSAQGLASEVEVLVELVNEWHKHKKVPKIALTHFCSTILIIVDRNCSNDQTKFVACGGVEAFVNLVNRSSLATMADVAIMQDVCKVLTVVATNNVDSKTKFHAAQGCYVMSFFLRYKLHSTIMFKPLTAAFNMVLVAMGVQPNQQNDNELSTNKPNSSVGDGTVTTELASTHTTTATTATSVPELAPRLAPGPASGRASNTGQHHAQQTECSALLKLMAEAASANHAEQMCLRSALMKQIESAAVANQELQYALQTKVEKLEAQVASRSAVIEEMKSTIASQANQVDDAKAAHMDYKQQKEAAEAKLAATVDALQSLLLNADKAAAPV